MPPSSPAIFGCKPSTTPAPAFPRRPNAGPSSAPRRIPARWRPVLDFPGVPGVDYPDDEPEIVRDDRGRAIRCPSEAEALANVALASAAPDLLEELKTAVARVEIANAEGNPILSAWLPGARLAIAKAEGRAEQ